MTDELNTTNLTPPNEQDIDLAISQTIQKHNLLVILAGVAIVVWITLFLVALKNMDKIASEKKCKGKYGELKDIEKDLEYLDRL